MSVKRLDRSALRMHSQAALASIPAWVAFPVRQTYGKCGSGRIMETDLLSRLGDHAWETLSRTISMECRRPIEATKEEQVIPVMLFHEDGGGALGRVHTHPPPQEIEPPSTEEDPV